MRKILRILIGACVVVTCVQAAEEPMAKNDPSVAIQRLDQQSLAFTKNMGQWDERVLFRASENGMIIWFCQSGVYFQVFEHSAQPIDLVTESSLMQEEGSYSFHRDNEDVRYSLYKGTFVGHHGPLISVGNNELSHKCHYLLGKYPSDWHTNVPSFSSITYLNVSDRVDVMFYGTQAGTLTYEIVDIGSRLPVSSAARNEDILSISTVEQDITSFGEGLDSLNQGSRLTDLATVLLSERSGQNSGSYNSLSFLGGNTRGFTPLELAYSTYVGGSLRDGNWHAAIAVDGSKCAYVTGDTYSTDFPLANPYDESFNGGTYDIFVTKFSPDGAGLEYSTFLGGSDWDASYGIDVDNSGCAYITGRTWSSNFPVHNAFDSLKSSVHDAFVTKLSPAGDALVFSTYLGGSDQDHGYAIAVDNLECAYVTGATNAADFPVLNAYDSSINSASDIFVTKLSSSGLSLIFSTFLGGTGAEEGWAIAVDGNGSAYVAGSTGSTDFPTVNAFDDSFNGADEDAYLAKFSPSGTTLEYSTYLGGAARDYCWSVDVDESFCAYVGGTTYSEDFPLLNAVDSVLAGVCDAFVAKLGASGDFLAYSTLLGGSAPDVALGIVVDDLGCVYLTGNTSSLDFPLFLAFDSTQNGYGNCFLTRFAQSGLSLEYSTLFGGGSSSAEKCWGVAVDADGAAYLAGYTEADDFPTFNAYDETLGGFRDVFVTKFLPLHHYVCGDVDATGAVDIDDVVYLINYIFAGGPQPEPIESGESDCSGTIDIDDVVYMINYIFAGGPEPCAGCP